MKYFIDTEFLEGTQNKNFLGVNVGKTKPTIDLISIGIVSEDNREYYAISKDFNLKEAWNRFDVKYNHNLFGGKPHKVYWLRENVLLPIYLDLLKMGNIYGDERNRWLFTYSDLKKLINKYGKTNRQIENEIKYFIDIGDQFPDAMLRERPDLCTQEFYAYYADYDWVAFCWLFGRMIELPSNFPMFAFDIQQQIEEYKIDKEQLLKEVPQINCHNALQDSIWNYNAYKWIQNKINNGK